MYPVNQAGGMTGTEKWSRVNIVLPRELGWKFSLLKRFICTVLLLQVIHYQFNQIQTNFRLFVSFTTQVLQKTAFQSQNPTYSQKIKLLMILKHTSQVYVGYHENQIKLFKHP